jgi:hypothetical protein
MRYGEINPAAPVISDDQAKKNATDLKNATAVGTTGLTTDPNELKCLKNKAYLRLVHQLF